jgi:hypothetical protein
VDGWIINVRTVGTASDATRPRTSITFSGIWRYEGVRLQNTQEPAASVSSVINLAVLPAIAGVEWISLPNHDQPETRVPPQGWPTSGFVIGVMTKSIKDRNDLEIHSHSHLYPTIYLSRSVAPPNSTSSLNPIASCSTLIVHDFTSLFLFPCHPLHPETCRHA